MGESASQKFTNSRTLHLKKIINSLTLHRVPLDTPSPQCVPSLPPTMSCLPHTAGTGPSHRPGQVPPNLALHLASQEKAKPLRVNTFSPQNTPVIPSTGEHLRAGDRHRPLAGCALDQAATGSIFPPHFLSMTIHCSSWPRRGGRHGSVIIPLQAIPSAKPCARMKALPLLLLRCPRGAQGAQGCETEHGLQPLQGCSVCPSSPQRLGLDFMAWEKVLMGLENGGGA